MNPSTITSKFSWMFLIIGIISPIFVFAQPSSHYPDDETSFMAEAQRAYQAGNQAKYLDMYKVGVMRGYADAESNLGAILMFLPSTESKNYQVMAFELFSRAANKNHAGAMYILATCYESGIGVTADHEMYMYWMKRAAKAGSPEAQNACQYNNLGCR